MDWMDNQISDAENESNEVSPKSGQEFADQIRTMLGTNTVESLKISLLRERVPDVEDTEALQSAFDMDTRDEAKEIYRDRLEDLDAFDSDTDEETEDGATEEDSSEESEDDAPDPFSDDSDDETDESEDAASPFGESGEGEEEETDSEDESADTDTEETTEPETTETPGPSSEPETAETDGGPEAAESSGAPSIDVKQIAPDVMTADEAAERDPRYTMLVWADPGQGKTHFACSGPDPVVIIDTEGKADEVAGKFRGEGRVPESPFIFQPSDYDEAVEALHSALDILDEYRVKADMTGTLVVDSISVMWGWSQQKYVDKFYPGKDAEEVEFNSAIGGGQSDWKQIKRYHNVKFRQVMLDSPYNLIWTAMREDDFEEQMKGNRDAEKPAGEKENPYKVDEVLRIQEGADGAPVGVLNKSGKVKHRYAGLRYPTFEKHRDLIDSILDAENGSRSIEAVAGEQGVRIHEGNPNYQEDDE